MKTILPWILVVAFAASAGALYFSNSSKNDELTKMREQVQQVDTLTSQADDLQKQVASQKDQIAEMHKDTDELLRLRNQVRQLTDDKAQLTKQMQAAQSQAERSQAAIQQAQASATQMAEQRILQMKQNEAVVSTCINNLRQIQAAKQQWAMEHQKGPDAVPTPQDIVAYFPNQMLPQCPGGGRYTLNAVSAMPTCSIPGHVLQ